MSGSPHHPTVAMPDDLYASPPPWDIGQPQPAFLALAEAGAVTGRVLDVGCGTGEHALLCAARGLETTGVDLARRALHAAEQKAGERGLTARFLHHDALHLNDLGESFDTVLDCGLFHIFDDTGNARARYADSIRSALRPDGRYFMLCISEDEPRDWGPHRITRPDITGTFTQGWRIDSIEPSTIDVTPDPGTVRAWLVALTRI